MRYLITTTPTSLVNLLLISSIHTYQYITLHTHEYHNKSLINIHLRNESIPNQIIRTIHTYINISVGYKYSQMKLHINRNTRDEQSKEITLEDKPPIALPFYETPMARFWHTSLSYLCISTLHGRLSMEENFPWKLGVAFSLLWWSIQEKWFLGAKLGGAPVEREAKVVYIYVGQIWAWMGCEKTWMPLKILWFWLGQG